jgi:capsular polysaccharide biosynthesis protein/Mrp family chromosome partitioning ATPase
MGNPRVGLASLLRRWWLLILLAMAGGALIAYAFGSRASPAYEASVRVLVEAPEASGGARQAAGLAPTYAELVKSTPVLAFALHSAGTRASMEELRKKIRGESDQDTRLITILADAGNRKDAVALANGLADGLRSYVSAGAAPVASGSQSTQTQIRVVERATSAARVRPVSRLLIEFGAAAGLFGALAFAFVSEGRRPRVGDAEELLELGGLPVLGSVNGLSAFDPARPSPAESAAYRRLATRIAIASEHDEPRSLVVVGADGAESSRTVAAKLGRALAYDGRRVVLADLEGDGIKRFFRIGQRGGLQVMKRVEPLAHASMTMDRFALRSGAPLVLALPRVQARGLSLEAAQEVVSLLSDDADVVIVHAPPPSRSRGALTWAHAAQATVLVVRGEHTKRANVEKALAGLETAGTKLVGAVLETGRR